MNINSPLRVSYIIGVFPKGMWPLSMRTIISTKSILQGNFVSTHSPLGDPNVSIPIKIIIHFRYGYTWSYNCGYFSF